MPTWYWSISRIDNPNVWYELGVRHALRSRGIVHVSSRTSRTPFDVATDRQFRYQLVEGAPDPDTSTSRSMRWRELRSAPSSPGAVGKSALSTRCCRF